MKLSQRLHTIASMIDGHYSHIWDCCCDHGLLGATLLKQGRCDAMHFVDIVPSITNSLIAKLEQFYPLAALSQQTWHVHCLDVHALPLAQYRSQSPQLVIIAGVGGELTASFVKAIQQHALAIGQSVEFILCPVHHTYQLREALSSLTLGLVNEHLITENKRFYEILHLSSDATTPVSLVGDKIWSHHNTDINQHYLTRLLNHYRLAIKGATDETHAAMLREAISAYQALTPQQ
ncbi:tRNA (adenine(22)-N(1))-methyltransferase [Shewanella colwelliana]|uniref:tRNA (adenine(22)-N(1))-methyltransferase n=1 Tax=Shewanella colwelliana TaxID=23 RepID=UPI0022AF868E|nr:tRNA (adenine(22)-N(1))-methyltransferase TrmK [Shewanella colwelliana]MCZ4336369.1 tRNA (adenine(22)-N(1))-methyltransferase TrmK [Shewanella colwelliana]